MSLVPYVRNPSLIDLSLYYFNRGGPRLKEKYHLLISQGIYKTEIVRYSDAIMISIRKSQWGGKKPSSEQGLNSEQ